MADLVKLGVVIDPSGANTGASEFKSILQAMSKAAGDMQAAVTAAAKKTGTDLAGAGQAGSSAGGKIKDGADAGARAMSGLDAAVSRARSGLEGMGSSLSRVLEFAGGGILSEAIMGGVEKALEIPAKVIETGIEYDDVIKRTQISIAGMLESQRPDQINDWNTALKVSGQVVDSLRDKVQQYHFASIDVLQDEFRSVATGTSTWGISINTQIDLASKLLATMRAMNVDGQQAARDTIDLLMGRGERIVAAKEVLQPFGGVDKFNDILAKVQNGTMNAQALVDMLEKASTKYAEAAAHGNEVLSTSFDSFKQQISQALGKEEQPLYDALVDNLNRVREEMGNADFHDALAPFVAMLKQAVDYAGQLAVLLETNPGDFMEGVKVTANKVWEDSINYLIGLIPTLEPEFKNVGTAFVELLINGAFQMAAILDTAVSTLGKRMEAQLMVKDSQLHLDWSPYDTDPNSDFQKNAQKIQYWQKQSQLSTYLTGDDFKAKLAEYQQAARAAMTNMGMNPDAGLVPPQTQTQANDAYNQFWKKQQMEDYAKRQQEQMAHSYDPTSDFAAMMGQTGTGDGTDIMDQNGKASSEGLSKLDYVKQVQAKMLDDKIAQLDAEATGNQKLIDQANDLVKVDEYEKQQLDLINEKHSVTAEEMAKVKEKTDEYAASLQKATQHMEDQKNMALQINQAENQLASAKARTTQVQKDPFTDQINKRPELIASYNQEMDAMQKIIALDQQAIDSGEIKDQAAILGRQKEIQSLQQEIQALQVEKSLQTDAGQFTADLTKYMDSLGTVGSRNAQIITGTLNTAIQSTTDNLTKAMDGTEKWGQAFQNIGMQILQTLEQLIIKMTLMQLVQSSLGAMGVGGGGILSLFGGAAAGAHDGGIVGMNASFKTAPRFHDGGVADDEQLAVLQKGEMVLTRSQQNAMKGAGGSGRAPIHVHVTNVSDPNAAAQELAVNPNAVLNILSRNKTVVQSILR